MKQLATLVKKAGTIFHETVIAPNLRIYGRILDGYLSFCTRTVPDIVSRKATFMERDGLKYCYGRLARNHMPLGIVIRDTARAAQLPFKTVTGIVAMNVAAALLPAALALCGGLLAVPRALCNIGTGRAVTREYLAEKERARQPRALYAWEVDSLPRLQRIFHYELDKIAEAPEHERVQWLEGLKHKFPDDFAKAAVLGPEELATTLKHEVQVKKKPLHIKKHKRGLTQKIGGVFGRA